MTSATRSSLLGAGIGAAAMFLADPVRGPRRRALVRDKLVWATRKTRDGAEATWRDLGNRVYGLGARVRPESSWQSTDDSMLTERVRTAIRRATSHPRAISVMVVDGLVVLTGEVLAAEAQAVVAAVTRVSGIEGIEDRLRRHVTSGSIPMMQEGSPRQRPRRTWLTSGWSPTAKLIVGLAGLGVCTLATFGRR